jgi:uncharacterized protein (AIM24 family)
MIHADTQLQTDIDVGGCGQGCRRCCCAGESFFRLNYTNTSQQERLLALTAKNPAKIIPIDLAQYPDGVVFRSRGFLAALGKDWRIELITNDCSTACCGGCVCLCMYVSVLSFVSACFCQ